MSSMSAWRTHLRTDVDAETQLVRDSHGLNETQWTVELRREETDSTVSATPG